MGKIIVITGCMGSGKTKLLLEIANIQFIETKERQYFIKPIIDIRHPNCIQSRDGIRKYANEFPINMKTIEFLEYVFEFKRNNIKNVYIDECQFFGEWIIHFINELRLNNINVIISGLDMDSNMKPFGYIGHLMCIADDIIKLSSKCKICGDKAIFSFKLNDNPSIISIGGDEKYESRCLKHMKIELCT